ncbi:hypothetical protein BC827DRAFT_1273223 [Russula dissimulans]|nr:hypothetical protein BC827DRAFT_1273223 [Russula dissimulans]
MKCQRFHFADNQTFTPLVNQVLQEEHNFSLLTKVQAFHNACRQVKKHAAELALARRKMHRALEDEFLSIEKLSTANAHGQIEPHSATSRTRGSKDQPPVPTNANGATATAMADHSATTSNVVKCVEDPVTTSGTAASHTPSVSSTRSAMSQSTTPGNTSDIATPLYAPTALKT